MIFALKSTFNLKKLKILRPKVTEIFTNLRKKFCEYPPRTRSATFTTTLELKKKVEEN